LSPAKTELAVRDSSIDFPPGAAHRSATSAPSGIAAYSLTSVAAGSWTKNKPFLNAPSSVSVIPPEIAMLSCT
jgi:hypothetical protein